MRISDWSSDVCSSDLKEAKVRASLQATAHRGRAAPHPAAVPRRSSACCGAGPVRAPAPRPLPIARAPKRFQSAWRHHCAHGRSEEHTSELQSLMRISYAVFCLKKKKKTMIINSEDINHT